MRRNIVRQVPDPRPLLNDASGIYFERCTNAVVENNLLNDTGTVSSVPAAVLYKNCQSVKFFNNESTAGQLLRGRDAVTGIIKTELEDAVQDELLAL